MEIPAASTNKNATARVAFLLVFAVAGIDSAGRGARQGFGEHCSPLLERLRACKREDREIPTVSIEQSLTS
ncbi:hypothetical protein Q8A64_09800 [Oxalobacteraceae bacterium R-40]|uniref:Secreted protein n=1 Tax=Keguizhuia sedimenti TaxID=3064264 RepID=A0ABU1BQH9_9BURK|nr:hypothetical protein [Oxalobacteraceae bacterium R-40]